jgi:hypothetical protein
MNTAFINIIKRITAEYGESSLEDSVWINGYAKHYAKGEPKEERIAFGHCIEQGFYCELEHTENGQLIRTLLSAE